MNSNASRLTVLLLLLAVAWAASAQRRGIRTCSCQMGSGVSQQGKLVGSVCYVVGVGSCRSFAYEQPAQQQQQFASQRRFGSSRFPFRSRFQSRFGTNRPSHFNGNQQSQFNNNQQTQINSNQPTQFTSNQPTQFNSHQPTGFNSHQPTRFSSNQPTRFSSNQPTRFSSPQPTRFSAPQPNRFSSNQPGRFDIAASAATASPEQHRSAAEETRRQLESRRTFERELVTSGVTVRPGSPEAAQANERRPDDKSAELGNKALAQILYLQSLLGRSSGRR